MKELIILGAGGHGKVVADIALMVGYDDIRFLDDDHPTRSHIGSWPIIGKLNNPMEKDLPKFVAIGNNLVRQQLSRTLESQNLVSIIHPRAVVSSRAKIGAGVVAVAGVVVNCDTDVGDGVILNTACSVDHDCKVADFSHISPGANLAGGVSIGPRTWVGIGSAVREGIKIGADCIIGAGSAVVKNVPDGETWLGVPAKVVRSA